MLIDEEQEPLGELEIEEKKSAELPDKYRTKSLEEVVRMHQEAEKLIGKQAQEVGEVRKLADELLKQNLSSKQQQVEVEPEVDFFENPQKQFKRRLINIQMFSRPDKRVSISKRCRFSRGLMQSILTTLKWSTILGFRSG